MLGLLSQYWLDDHHADGEVALINRTEMHCCGVGAEHVIARVPIHCIVASSASTYFSALLSPSWHQQESQHQQTAVRLVLGDAADIAAMLALLKCLYTGALDVDDADLYATLQLDSGSCSCNSSVRECLSSSHWQQLYLRVIKLADQFAVYGVMDVAVSKLTNLFSHQLEWNTIEAVLWMPASISREPRMAALKQLAINGVKQKLGVLDTALAQPSGRHMLQALPPDVLAAILSYDTLAATSENTVLAAVDIWSAGPIAHALAQQVDYPMDSDASCYNSSPSSSRSASSQLMVLEGSGDSEELHSTAQSPLLAALTLLLDSVRLNQCSGAFLASAVGHMPWLCKALQHKAADLQLLQQYYSSNSEGRYEMSMHLIQQTISCPWQPKLRKALPAGYDSSSSSRADQPGTFTLLSEVRTLLDTTIKQQITQKVRLFQAVCSPCAASPGLLLSEFAMGGYLWRLSLVGAPYRRARTQIAAAADGDGGERQRQQLAVCVICRPAWAANLDSFNSSGSSAGAAAGAGHMGRHPLTADPVAVAAATRLLGSRSAAIPDCQCATGSARHDAEVPAAVSAAAGLGTDLGSKCSVCRSLCGIAMSRSTAAVDRHLPAGLARTIPRGGSSGKDRSPWSYTQDVVVGVNVTAAPSAPLLQALLSVNAGKPPAEVHTAVRLAWSDSARAAYGLIPLDVSGIGIGSSNLVCGWACEGTDLPAGAVHPAVTANSTAAAAVGPAAGAMAAAAGEDAGARGDSSSLVVGWQPELWSRLAYTGGLHWHSSLRLLSD